MTRTLTALPAPGGVVPFANTSSEYVQQMLEGLSKQHGYTPDTPLGEWSEASRQSLFKQEVESTALDHDAGALRDLWSTLARTDLKALAEGRVR